MGIRVACRAVPVQSYVHHSDISSHMVTFFFFPFLFEFRKDEENEAITFSMS
jgi:hypothetical protein